jgi:hypothetical protein
VNQHIQFAPLPMFGRLEVCETNDLGLGLDFESWRELYGARVSGLAVDTPKVARLGSWVGDAVRMKPALSIGQRRTKLTTHTTFFFSKIMKGFSPDDYQCKL